MQHLHDGSRQDDGERESLAGDLDQAEDRERKWWHVPDDALEALVHRMASGQDGKPQAGSLRKLPASTRTARHQSVPTRTARQQSVRFEFGDLQAEDALDRELQLDAERTLLACGSPTREMTSVGSNSKGKQGKQWKVPDERIIEFIQEKAKATATQGVVMEASVGGHLAPVGRMLLTGNLRRCSQCARLDCPDCGSPTAASNSRASSATRGERQDGRSMAKRKGGQPRSQSQTELDKRPPWDKNINARYFAHVGSGLDGKGNKVIKYMGARFESNPIYLPDARNNELARVRESVAGHVCYMNRR